MTHTNIAEKTTTPTKKRAKTKPYKLSPKQHKQRETIAWLCQTFPKAFHLHNRVPLKIGILNDLFSALEHLKNNTEDGSAVIPSRTNIRHAIQHYTHSKSYRGRFFQHTHRHDLDGQPIEDISLEHQDFAGQQFKIHKNPKA